MITVLIIILGLTWSGVGFFVFLENDLPNKLLNIILRLPLYGPVGAICAIISYWWDKTSD